jgi:pyruvate/2-oxoglutarate dehydrogenase complex dihydrolipoamide acyltransferase (E2) component
MPDLIEVRMPRYPECWDSCGNCASGDVFVIDVLVAPGDVLRADDNLITLETGKVALDIPSPYAGRVVAVHLQVGDKPEAGALIATLEKI